MKAAELFCEKGVLKCALAKEFEVFWTVQSRGTLTKLGALRCSHGSCAVRKGVLRNLANFSGQISYRLQACNFIKIETLAQVFSGEFCEISKNTFFTEHL